MKASDIADRYYQQTNDPNFVRTAQADLFRWITAGQLLMAVVRPDSVAATQTLTLAAGTKQSLAADQMRLLAVHRAIDPADATKTLAVTKFVDAALLDASGNWHQATKSNAVRNVVYDNRNPDTFWVYPPAKAGAKLEATVTVTPTAVTALTDTLAVPDAFMDPLLEYCLFRYYSFDTEYSLQPQLATGHLQSMSMMLGVKLARDVALSPNFNTKGVAPTAGAANGGV